MKYVDQEKSLGWIQKNTETPRSTIQNIIKHRSKIEEHLNEELNGRMKTMQRVTHPALEKELFLWFVTQRELKKPISQLILQRKATSLHQTMCEIPGCKFKASLGFVRKFRRRHRIRQLTLTGEKLSSNSDGIDDFISDLLEKLVERNLTLDNLYNADESGLLYKEIVSRTLVTQEEKNAPGKKKSKDRLTFTACSNVTGTCRINLQVLGKSAKPRCFLGKELPSNIFYDANKKAWQTKETFKKYFSEVIGPTIQKFNEDNNLPAGAILILDNASSHNLYDDFTNDFGIEILFLPPNCTSLVQPMDQSVIEPLKKHYRDKLMTFLMEEEDWITKLKDVSVLLALNWISKAWIELANVVFIKSWKPLLSNFEGYRRLRNDASNESNDRTKETNCETDTNESLENQNVEHHEELIETNDILHQSNLSSEVTNAFETLIDFSHNENDLELSYYLNVKFNYYLTK